MTHPTTALHEPATQDASRAVLDCQGGRWAHGLSHGAARTWGWNLPCTRVHRAVRTRLAKMQGTGGNVLPQRRCRGAVTGSRDERKAGSNGNAQTAARSSERNASHDPPNVVAERRGLRVRPNRGHDALRLHMPSGWHARGSPGGTWTRG